MTLIKDWRPALILFISGVFTYCFLASISSAGPESIRDDWNRGTDFLNSKNTYYVKDKRSNLCFLAHNVGRKEGLITNVPCTTEVKAALINNTE